MFQVSTVRSVCKCTFETKAMLLQVFIDELRSMCSIGLGHFTFFSLMFLGYFCNYALKEWVLVKSVTFQL